MGSLQAQEYAALAGSGDLSLHLAIEIHLQSNHYPPVPLSMVEPCIQAIEIANAAQWGDADLSDRVTLPDGVSWRGEDTAPAWALIESHHLDSFIQWEEE